MNKTLYVFGDSFSTPNFCVAPADSFWGLLAKDLQVDNIVNYSHSGFSLDQIIHILCNESFDFSQGYYIIGIPPVARLAIYQESNKLTQWPYSTFNQNFQQQKYNTESVSGTQQFDFHEIFAQEKYFMANYYHSWQETITCDKILLIYNLLKAHSAKFVIVNLTIPIRYEPDWPVSKNIMLKIKTLRECIIFDNTCHSVNEADNIRPAAEDWKKGAGWFGHHAAEGNANWYNKILYPLVKELGWV